MGKNRHSAGFTMTELAMVTVIIGVLATLGTGTFNSVIVTARRGEAKTNLAHLSSLQAIYGVEYSGNYAQVSVGYVNGSYPTPMCDDTNPTQLGNALGFFNGRKKECEALRYGYMTSGNSPMDADMIATSYSDRDKKWIYPDCDGTGTSKSCAGYSYAKGDVVCLESGVMEIRRNIVEYCD